MDSARLSCVLDKGNVVNLPTADGMRNIDIDLGRRCRVVQTCMKIASRLKKVRLELNVSLHVDRPHRCSELLKPRNKLLLH